MRFASPAGCAFEDSFRRNGDFENGQVTAWAVFVHIVVKAERYEPWIEFFARVIGRAVFGTAATFHTRIRLQRGKAGDVISADEAAILVVAQRGDLAEARALEKE